MGEAKDHKSGSVVVVGSGIAGIQAALNLAQLGYGVHLVEKEASLGGMMPKLHRIYPLCICGGRGSDNLAPLAGAPRPVAGRRATISRNVCCCAT